MSVQPDLSLVEDADAQRRMRAVACRACGSPNEHAEEHVIVLEQRLAEALEKVTNVAEYNHRLQSEIRRLKRDTDQQLKNDPNYEAAVEVLQYWSDVLHPDARQLFGGERLKNVLDRLSSKHGKPYSAEELKTCVRGYAFMPYVVNSRRVTTGSPAQRKIDAELIFRDPQRVNNGIAFAMEAERRAQPLPDMKVVPTPSHPTTGLSALGTAAVKLVSEPIGFHVFPIAPKDKRPVTPNGLKDATRDIDRIMRFWSQNPHHNIGIRCGIESGLVVLDVDVDEASEDNGLETLRLLEAKFEPLPPTASVVTPRGGQHYYFRHPDQGEIRNTTGYPGPGLDIRGVGGYVLAPPSIGANGKRYEVDDSLPIAEMPPWLIRLLVERQSEAREIRRDYAQLVKMGVSSGQRNTQLLSLTGHLWSHEHEMTEIFDMVMAVNEARCKPPVAAKEVEKIVQSVARMRAREALANATK